MSPRNENISYVYEMMRQKKETNLQVYQAMR
jgi:hypothetical protein